LKGRNFGKYKLAKKQKVASEAKPKAY